MSDPVPLEKVLLPVDISGGVNERERAETADPFKTLTRVENLVQDQTTSYIKRPAMSILGSTLDYDGFDIASPTKAIRLKKGLAIIANSGSLYHYQEGQELFLKKGVMPQYTVQSADMITGSGSVGSGYISSTASSSKFHAMIADGQEGTVLSLYERASGCTVKHLSMEYLITQAYCVFVADRYLHVYFIKSSTDLWGFVIDTEAPVSVVASLLMTGTTGSMLDVAAHTDRSFVLFHDAAVADHVVSMDNTGAVVDSATVTTGTVSMSNSGTRLWLMDATNLRALSPTSLATTMVAAGAHGVTAGRIVASPSNVVHSLYETTSSFGGTVIPTIYVSGASAVDGTALTVLGYIDGWTLQSAPFVGVDGTSVFVHIAKSTSDGLGAHVVANITPTDESFVVKSGNYYYSWRIACSLDPHIGYTNKIPLRYLSYDGNDTYCPALPVLVAERSYGYAAFTIRPYRHADIGSATFGGSTYISGGCHSVYGGDHLSEAGFVDSPILNAAEGSATGLTGSYKYIAVYRRNDETGAVTWSRTSPIASIIVTNHKVDLTVCPATVTNSDLSISQIAYESPQPPPVASVDLYRTKNGGTQYYLVSSDLPLAASRYYTFTDNVSDATLGTQQLLFRQPGTTNSPVDRYPPPSGNFICSHKDRLFTADPYGLRVYYSSFFVDGETAWYNPVFSFFVHGGTGPITGLVSMDGRLFIFKRDGVFVVDGDGPAEGGVAGNEFSPPQRLATEYGCVDARSIVVTTNGIFYRSARGVEVLTRSLQVKWIGERIQSTVDSHPKTCGSVLDAFGRVHYLLAASLSDAMTVAGIAGVEAVYDLTTDAWTIHIGTGSDGVYGNAMQDITMADLDGLGETVVYADALLGVAYADETSGIDRGAYYVPWVIESGWFRSGQQARQRISQVLLLAKKSVGASHAIRMSLAYDFSDTYTQTFTWQPGDLSDLAVEELDIQPERPQSLAVRVLIEEIEPSDTEVTGFTAQLGTVLSYLGNIEPGQFTPSDFPVGTGRGCDVLGITVEIAQKRGAPKLSAGQKA